MKKLGLIGGTSWHSTIDYYRFINQSINDHFGDNTNPPLMVYTIDQAENHRFQNEGKWDSIAVLLLDAGESLQRGGAEAVMFCANTPHKVYDLVDKELDIPVIHIADATAKAILDKGIAKVGFVGTKFTMEEDFITGRIKDRGIEVMVPEDQETITELQRIIIDELTYGNIEKTSKAYVVKVLQSMIDAGAEGVVLGCTEFPLMIFDEDLSVPIFNTSDIHAEAAVEFILEKE
ncbi:UNVERIFIED_CONTAM: hypothetical protein GTU68_030604 [Idotea baltica]|nr:hypothetical protein [Idotea baltica]